MLFCILIAIIIIIALCVRHCDKCVRCCDTTAGHYKNHKYCMRRFDWELEPEMVFQTITCCVVNRFSLTWHLRMINLGRNWFGTAYVISVTNSDWEITRDEVENNHLPAYRIVLIRSTYDIFDDTILQHVCMPILWYSTAKRGHFCFAYSCSQRLFWFWILVCDKTLRFVAKSSEPSRR